MKIKRDHIILIDLNKISYMWFISYNFVLTVKLYNVFYVYRMFMFMYNIVSFNI